MSKPAPSGAPIRSASTPHPDDLPRLLDGTRRSSSVTWRSLIVGTVAVIIVCGLTPLNDFILSDTSLAAGFFPLIAVLLLFLLVVAFNAPLHRWAPRHALGTGELAVVVLMVMVACSLPNWGLMRFFIPTPIAPFHLGASDEQFWKAFIAMDLPKWLFPVSDVHTGRTSPVATWFFTRVPEGEHTPFGAWIMPLLTWGVFAAAMLATLAAIARLVLEQWATNERLPFPLVQVQSALIEAPSPGFALNALFRSRILWIGLGAVFAIHLLSCLNAYSPRHFPQIPLKYDLTGILSEEPFYYLRGKVKKAFVYFTIIGLTYFIRSRAAFSLWATYLLVNVVDVQQGMQQTEIPPGAWADQHLGACVAFAGAIIWIGRHHWMRILKSALGRGQDRVYRTPFWIAVTGIAVMIGWLLLVGVQLAMAAGIVLFIVAAHLIVSRVVAETGLPYYRTGIGVSQLYTNCPPSWFSGRDVYFASVFTVLGPVATRDSLMTFTQQGLGVCGNSGVGGRDQRRLAGVIAWALLVGFVVAAFTTLACQYAYPTPASTEDRPARNYFGAEYVQKREVGNPVVEFSRGRFAAKPHNPAVHMGIGFGVTTLLEVAALRWASWPLLPVGFVTSHGAFIENAWLSILIGWLAQLVIVRVGGATLFQRARPFFIGIIFGEALAAGMWLLINAILVMNGAESQAVRFVP